ncbi:hypothetical protein [Azospirillum argentinense]
MADIIIGDEQPRRVYTVGNTPQTVFTAPFPFLADTDVHVVVNSGQADEDLDLGADYTVTGAGTQSGTVTLTTPVSNCTVTVYRELMIERSTQFPAAGTLKMPALNREFDRVVMMLQQQLDKLKRSISLAASDDLDTNATLPVAQQRAGRLIAFDREGRPVMSDATVAQIEGVTIGAYLDGQSVGDVTGFVGDGVTTRYDTGHNIVSKSSVTVVIGGVKQAPDAYSIDGQEVVLKAPAPEGVKVDIRVIGVNVALADASGAQITAAGSTTARSLAEWASDVAAVISPDDRTVQVMDVGGFYPDREPATKVHRLRDRMFIGASTVASGTYSSGIVHAPTWRNGAGTSGGPAWAESSGQFVVTATIGNAAIVGASRASDYPSWASATYAAPIGLVGAVLNDKSGVNGWAAYLEAVLAPEAGAGSVYAAEIAVKSQYGNRTRRPYRTDAWNSSGAHGLWFAGGGDASYGGGPTAPSNTAIIIGKNSAQWNRGIVIDANVNRVGFPRDHLC